MHTELRSMPGQWVLMLSLAVSACGGTPQNDHMAAPGANVQVEREALSGTEVAAEPEPGPVRENESIGDVVQPVEGGSNDAEVEETLEPFDADACNTHCSGLPESCGYNQVVDAIERCYQRYRNPRDRSRNCRSYRPRRVSCDPRCCAVDANVN